MAGLVATATLLASAGLAQSASAAEGDGSTASGRVLSGSLLSTLDTGVLIALQGASASSAGTVDSTDDGDLDVTLLSTLGLTVTDGVQIPLSIADLGVLGEYAEANSDGSAIGASGVVGDDGTIGVGPTGPGAPAAFTLELDDLLDSAITSTVAGASLEVGAVSARAETDGAAPATGSYDIAALRLALDSPVVGGLAGSIRTAVSAALDPAVAGLVGPNGQIASVVAGVSGLPVDPASATVTIAVDVPAALDPILGPTAPALGAGGPIEIDLATGEVTVDIRALLEANGQDLNSLAPNTEILSAPVLSLINQGVANLLTDLVDDVIDAVRTAIEQAVVTVDVTLRADLGILGTVDAVRVGFAGTVSDVVAGTVTPTVTVLNNLVCGLPVVGALVCGPTLGGLVVAGVGTLLSTTLLDPGPTGLLATLAATVGTTVVDPALTLLDPALENVVTGIVSLRANVQEPTPSVPGATFTETALRLELLDFVGTQGALRLDLAAGAVGPADVVVPVVTTLTPPRGPETGGTQVTIDGSGFLGATGVTFGGVPGTDFVVVDDTRILVTTPAGASGTVDAVVQSAAGASAPLDFEYFDVTQVLAIAPAEGPSAGGTSVVITGECFTGATAVTFGGVAAASFVVDSDTQITAVTPPATGLVDVTVTAPGDCGVGTLPDGFAFVAPGAPDILTLTPDDGPVTGGTPVVITGTGFTGTTAVTFDGVPATFTVDSPTQITAVSPPHATGSVPVIVTGPVGDSAPAAFAYNPAPSVASVVPDRGPETGGTVVTITGAGLADATGVTFDGVAGTDFSYDPDTGRLTVTSPAHVPATVALVVVSPNGPSAPVDFTYFGVTDVASVSPAQGAEVGGDTVTITGDCFTASTGVLFGSVAAASFVVDSDTQITAVTPAGVGLVDVTVVVPGECGPGILPDAFAFVAPGAPVITTVVPDRGPETGDTAVTITGTGFADATGVTFDGIQGTDVQVSPTGDTISVRTPVHAPGPVAVVVTNAAGDSAPAVFTYFPVPAVSSLVPDSGPTTGATPVVIRGTGFAQATGVTFDGLAGTAFSVVSDTEIRVSSPAHPVGVVDVIVVSPDSQSAPVDFTYVAPPTVASLTPDRGPTSGATPVTITGTGFLGATSVTFDGLPSADFTVVSDTEISVDSPAHVVGQVPVVVRSPFGDAAAGAFTYYATPAITALDPVSGPVAGGTSVVVTGTGFAGATSVTFDGIPGTSFVLLPDGSIRVTTPPHAAGPVEVIVRNADAASAPASFTYVAAPAIASIAPPQGPTVGGTPVTITGTGFGGATGVTFDGIPGTSFAVQPDGSIRVTTPPHAVGPVDVVIQSPFGVSAPGDFTYVAAPAAITGLQPAQGPVTGDTPVVITGSGFTGATGVTFDGVPGTGLVVVSDTSISVVSPANPVGPADVVVQSPSGDSSPAVFEYQQVTVVQGVDPDSGSDLGGQAVTLTGQCFLGATAVLFGSTPAAGFSVVSDTVITAVTPAGIGLGLVDVSVVAPAPCGTGILPDGFAFVNADAPVVTGIAPDEGPADGGTEVVITGSGFTDATGVTFEDVPGTAFTVVSDTEIRVTSPAGTVGLADLVVQHPSGDAAPVDFRYTAVTAPVLLAIDPPNGSTLGGTVVTLTGSGFTGATEVLFGAASARSFRVISDEEIEAVTPPGAAGDVDVRVANDAGVSDAVAFEYILSTVVTEVTPDLTPGATGWGVTITGTCFTGATQVLFGTTPAQSFSVIDDSTIRAIAPTGTGTTSISVISPCGTFVLADGFTFPVTQPAAVGSGGVGSSGAGTGSSGRALAYTGSDPSSLAMIALLLTLMGAAVVIRRRFAS